MKFNANDSPIYVVDKHGIHELAEETASKWPNYANPVDALESIFATIRKEARREVFDEALRWAQKVYAVKLDAARDAQTKRVIDTLNAAALERAAKEKENDG